MLPLPRDGPRLERMSQPHVSGSPSMEMPAAAADLAASKSGAARSSTAQIDDGTTAESDSDSVLRFSGKIGRHDGDILIDSGATYNFISEAFVKKNRLRTTMTNSPIKVQLADGTTYECAAFLPSVEVKIGPYRSKASYYVLPMRGNDAILGTSWLTTTNPQIDWRTKTITIRQGGHEIRLRPDGLPSTSLGDEN